MVSLTVKYPVFFWRLPLVSWLKFQTSVASRLASLLILLGKWQEMRFGHEISEKSVTTIWLVLSSCILKLFSGIPHLAVFIAYGTMARLVTLAILSDNTPPGDKLCRIWSRFFSTDVRFRPTRVPKKLPLLEFSVWKWIQTIQKSLNKMEQLVGMQKYKKREIRINLPH